MTWYTYKVVDEDGNDLGTTIQVASNSDVNHYSGSVPSKDGYTFAYFTWPGYNEPIKDGASPVDWTDTIVAHFTKDEEPVTWYTYKVVDEDGNDLGTTIQVASNSDVLSYSGVEPSKDGYTFAYFTWPGYNEPIKDGASPVDWTDTIVAHFTKDAEPQAQTITYKLVDDEGNVIDDNATCVEGQSLLKTMSGSYDSETWGDSLMAPQKDGYEFLGWTYEGYENDKYLDSDAVASSSTVTTLVAHFAKNEAPQGQDIQYKLVDDLGNVICDSAVCVEGQSLLETMSGSYDSETWGDSLMAPQKDGYKFVGWTYEGYDKYLDSDATAETYTVKTLVAHFVIDETQAQDIHYTLVDDEGNLISNTAVCVKGQSLLNTMSGSYDSSKWGDSLMAPQKDGYTFLGWTYEGYDKYLEPEAIATDGTVTTLVAHFQKNEEAQGQDINYKLTADFDGDGIGEVTISDTAVCVEGQPLLSGMSGSWNSEEWGSDLMNPEVYGYEFLGWTYEGYDKYLEPEATAETYTVTTLVAHFQKIEDERAQDINYKLVDDEGNVISDTAVCVEGQPLLSGMSGSWDASVWGDDLMAPQKDGYKFLGWTYEGYDKYLDSDATAETYTVTTLVAHFEKNGTDTPGTDEPSNPGTDEPGDNPGTDTPGTDEPGTDTPGTDEPGTGTEQPSTGDDQNQGGNQGSQDNNASKDQQSQQQNGNKNNIPKTGDETNTAAMATAGVAGAGFLGLGALLMNRFRRSSKKN